MSVILHCETSGAPRPAITWQKGEHRGQRRSVWEGPIMQRLQSLSITGVAVHSVQPLPLSQGFQHEPGAAWSLPLEDFESERVERVDE